MTEPDRRTTVQQVVQQRGTCLLIRTADDVDLSADRHARRALHVVTLGPGLGYFEGFSLSRADGRDHSAPSATFLTPGVPTLVIAVEQVTALLQGPDQGARIGRGGPEARNALSIRVFLADGLHTFLVNLKRGTIGLTDHPFFSVDAVL